MDLEISQLYADLNSQRLAETYLVAGGSADLRLNAVREFCRALLCLGSDAESGLFTEDTPARRRACGGCSGCLKMQESSHPDFFLLNFSTQARWLNLKDEEASKQKELRIESVRQMLRFASTTPLESVYKLFVIENAHLLSLEAANALLKSLEESTAHAHWFLLAESFQGVLPTIRSRARRIQLAAEKTIGLPVEPEWRAQLEEILAEKTRSPKSVFAFAQNIFAAKKKNTARQLGEAFARELLQIYRRKLEADPIERHALALLRTQRALQDLRQNVAAQLAIESLLLDLP